jgi:hypothetical protein
MDFLAISPELEDMILTCSNDWESWASVFRIATSPTSLDERALELRGLAIRRWANPLRIEDARMVVRDFEGVEGTARGRFLRACAGDSSLWQALFEVCQEPGEMDERLEHLRALATSRGFSLSMEDARWFFVTLDHDPQDRGSLYLAT